jgi:hypothetical protein
MGYDVDYLDHSEIINFIRFISGIAYLFVSILNNVIMKIDPMGK